MSRYHNDIIFNTSSCCCRYKMNYRFPLFLRQRQPRVKLWMLRHGKRKVSEQTSAGTLSCRSKSSYIRENLCYSNNACYEHKALTFSPSTLQIFHSWGIKDFFQLFWNWFHMMTLERVSFDCKTSSNTHHKHHIALNGNFLALTLERVLTAQVPF